MKCLKMIFGMVCIAFTFIISQEIIVSNTYAVSDKTVTYTSAPSQWDNVFPDCTGDCLNDYSYLIVEIDSPSFTNSSSYFYLYIRFDGSYGRILTISGSSSFAIYSLPFNGSPNNYLSFAGNNGFFNNNSITFTLTENYQSGITPSGSLSITENGTYDVTNYAEAVVNVPESSGGGSGGDYHQDLVNIYYAIITCGAICLVLYFFYCIYRMIIKSTGGK